MTSYFSAIIISVLLFLIIQKYFGGNVTQLSLRAKRLPVSTVEVFCRKNKIPLDFVEQVKSGLALEQAWTDITLLRTWGWGNSVVFVTNWRGCFTVLTKKYTFYARKPVTELLSVEKVALQSDEEGTDTISFSFVVELTYSTGFAPKPTLGGYFVLFYQGIKEKIVGDFV